MASKATFHPEWVQTWSKQFSHFKKKNQFWNTTTNRWPCKVDSERGTLPTVQQQLPNVAVKVQPTPLLIASTRLSLIHWSIVDFMWSDGTSDFHWGPQYPVQSPKQVCHYPPLAHARPCLSTGRALNRRSEEILGPLFLWSRMEDWVFVERLYRERGAQS